MITSVLFIALSAASPSLAQLLDRAQKLYDSGDYAEINAVTDQLKKRRAELTREQKLRTLWLSGSAIAIVENPIDARPDFENILDLAPDYAMPANTPVKIADVFKKAQTERREKREAEEAEKRKRIIAGLKLEDLPGGEAKGGAPLDFAVRLRDPGANVTGIRVFYRRAPATEYSSLALTPDTVGRWSGQLTAELMVSEKGFELESYLETSDAKGPLLVVGSAAAPRKIAVGAGSIAWRKPLPRWPFATLLAGTLAAGATAGVFGFVLSDTNQRKASAAAAMTITGSDAILLDSRGPTAALGTNVALVATGVLLAFTIVFFFLTDWER